MSRPVAIVTVAAKNLGAHLINYLAESGYDVVLNYRHSRLEAEKQAEQLSKKTSVLLFQGDLLDDLVCQQLISQTIGRFGRLDTLINNVGDYLEKDLTTLTMTDWRYILDSSLNTAVSVSQSALTHLLQSPNGRIINIGFASSGHSRPSTLVTPYVIAKDGLLTYTRSLAVAVKQSPLTINMVSPGVLETSVVYPPLTTIPKGRYGTYDDMSAAIDFLLKPEANYITGQHLEVSGGWRPGF
jgi:3-oxoacyl-[acyl-carrier protein] reductase